MTAEERAAAFVRAWESGGVPRGGLAVALAAAFRAAETAAAGRQREADAALLESWAAGAQIAAFKRWAAGMVSREPRWLIRSGNFPGGRDE